MNGGGAANLLVNRTRPMSRTTLGRLVVLTVVGVVAFTSACLVDGDAPAGLAALCISFGMPAIGLVPALPLEPTGSLSSAPANGYALVALDLPAPPPKR